MSRDDEEWGKRLLTNFPVFDPDWPNEVKLSWSADRGGNEATDDGGRVIE